MRKAHYHTLGCKLNRSETEQVAALLAAGGIAEPAPDRTIDPDLVFINSCTVTSRAAAKSRHLVASLVRRHINSIVMVAGCMAQFDPLSFANIEGVDYVLGMDARFSTGWWQGKPDRTVIDLALDPLKNDRQSAVNYIGSHLGRSRPFLKIQDGCDQNCTFCIIPRIRGSSRSIAKSNIVAAARRLGGDGASEIVLTGVRIGSWGQDLPEHASLHDLVRELAMLDEIDRIRLGSIEPWELTDELIEFAARHPVVCSHLHVPIQHTSERILEKMGRPGIADLLDRMTQAAEINRDLAFGTDIIAGFPGETEQDFSAMLKTLARLPLTYIHAFGFSRRPGTPAAEMDGQVSPGEIKRRVGEMNRLSSNLRKRFSRMQAGKWLSVVADHPAPGASWVNAVSDNYLKVRIPADANIAGTLLRVSTTLDADGALIFNP